MRLLATGVICSTAVVMLGSVAASQSPTQVPVPSQVQRPGPDGLSGPTQGQLVTVTGCVQRESDYRRIHQGSSSVTVVGTTGDVVLINAAVSVIGSTVAGTRAETPREIAAGGGSGSAAQAVGGIGIAPAATGAVAYQLTGPRESDAAVNAGRWVEVIGTLREPPPVTPQAVVTSGSTPTASEPARRDLQLRQLEIDSVRVLSGACAAQ